MTDLLSFDFATDDTEAGFRLHRIEVFNWGTFDRRISTLELDGLNTLVTGENGSGKSTFIDALTTLLVPANRIAYNRAAGAELRERSLNSYVLGHYRSEYNEGDGRSKPVALRDKTSYTVILGVFRNVGFDQVVTIAQVFWPAEHGQPNRKFVIAERELRIATHFRSFTKLKDLWTQLRSEGVEVHDQFPAYGARLRRLLGIQSEQALELFHQTVSMKAVGNLTDFVRAHMLDTEPIRPRLDALIAHFDDLTRAHAAVLRAKRQVDLLTPIVDDGARHEAESDGRALLERCRRALRPFVAQRKVELLAGELERLTSARATAEQRLARARTDRERTKQRIQDLTLDIASSGGGELARLEADIAARSSERDRRRDLLRSFERSVRVAELDVPTNEEEFVELTDSVSVRRSTLDAERAAHEDRRVEHEGDLRRLRVEHRELSEEIENLRAQRGNIPRAQIILRDRLCIELGIETSTIPFVGELLRVTEGAEAWEGAAERVLHSFALSLLVPQAYYPDVQRWVDRQHLGARLVYFNVQTRGARRDDEIHRFALLHKLDVRPELPPAIDTWLRAELANRANVACCETTEQFVREPRALTMAGQIKGANQRHEKDDRFALGDRSRYVLGWSNESKLAVLGRQLGDVESQAQSQAALIESARSALGRSQAVGEALAALEIVRSFREIDWQSVAAEISELDAARVALLGASDRLRELEAQLDDARRAYEASDQTANDRLQELGRCDDRIAQASSERDELIEAFGSDGDEEAVVVERLAGLLATAIATPPTRTKHLDDAEATVRENLTAEIDAAVKRIERLQEKIVRAMSGFRNEFPVETQEIDASLDALDEYEGLLGRLRADDLPRYEAEFRELLNTNTLREIAGFQAQLHQERTDIAERIEKINASLATIEYNRGRYIRLVQEPSRDQDIREFISDLRACTEGTLDATDNPAFVEQKFLQVREIIERFRGRPNFADADRRWTTKVTDVRMWFTFAASERFRTDNSEYEHYSDSSGKSGGQKEKLAYTVLAASLAYQFGLELGETTSRSFRFVAIDEAFGRADTEATRFGLELFARLHLQLLVVTPLQRISIIEPFVQRVGFVSVNDDRSGIANLTIEEYRKRRDERSAAT